jgi:hypothetical protein
MIAHRRWTAGVEVAHRGVVVACATAMLICACRDRRSAIRQEEPRPCRERWVTQSRVGGQSCHGVRPDAPPGLKTGLSHRRMRTMLHECVTAWLVKVEHHEPSGARERATPIARRIMALYQAELLYVALRSTTEETAS